MNFRPRMNSVSPSNNASKKKSSSIENTPTTKSLNKAVSNVLKRTPSKVLDDEDFLAAFKDDFPDTDLINDILNEDDEPDSDFEIIQTWFNQMKKIKVTEVATQCNFPYTQNNIEMDELYDKMHENDNIDIMSDCESDTYEDDYANLAEQVTDDKSIDMLSYVIDQLTQEGTSLDTGLPNLPTVPQIQRDVNMDMDIIQKILETDQDIDGGKLDFFNLPPNILLRFS